MREAFRSLAAWGRAVPAMPDSSPSLSFEALLEHSAWVRDLARRLAGAGEADDLEQQTWLAALGSRRRPGVPAREWLALVLRNFARQSRRSSAHRAQRERGAARAEATPSTSELLERAELQRRIAAAVTELAEPYRTAVLLRYFEGLPPGEIARRLDVPVATVRTRLARALERLRERFDREHGGDRGAWTAAFLPFLRPPLELAPPAGSLLLAMNKTVLASAAAVLVLGAAGWWYASRGASAAADGSGVAAESALSAPRPSPPAAGPASEPSPAREAVVAPPREPRAAPLAQAPAATAPASRTVRGRVLDAGGGPAASVRLVVRPLDGAAAGERSATSDALGHFEIADAPSSGTVAGGERELATVLQARFRAEDAREPIVIVAPRLELAGEVVDEGGAPLEDVELQVALPEDFRARFKEVLDASVAGSWSAFTAADGRFVLEGLPRIEGARLSARLDGFLPLELPLPESSDLALRLVLERPLATDGYVRGRVVDSSGRPIRGARVALGLDTATTPADGTFAFPIDDPRSLSARFGQPRTSVVAVKPGLLPARFDAPSAGGAPRWPSLVVLRLEGVPLSITGRVEDAGGEPMSGVRVYVTDATAFGGVDGRLAMVEGLLAGAEQLWHWVESDSDGRFEVEGLLDRDYVLRAHDPRTLLRADSGPVRAGASGVEIEIPTDELYPRVAGRVVSHTGVPIAGAEVFPMCDAFQARVGGEIVSTSHDAVEGTRTDAEGRFELTNVPKSLVYLRVNGENILPLEYGRYVEGDERFTDAIRELPRDRIESLELVVELRCHVQVELVDPSAADQVAFVDAKGRELTVSYFIGEGRREQPRHEILDGRTPVLGVPDSATQMVAFKSGVEVGRVPVKLAAEGVTTLRF
jgi:RNA polymerase sigma-70 factor (ECF subfamily)